MDGDGDVDDDEDSDDDDITCERVEAASGRIRRTTLNLSKSNQAKRGFNFWHTGRAGNNFFCEYVSM